MAIVLDLQEEALKSNSDVLSLLRKAYLVARKLSLKEFEEWINNELNGYEDTDKIPNYRKVNGELKAWNPARGWTPVMSPDNTLEDIISTREIPDSIPSLNSLLNINNNNGNFSISMNAKANLFLSQSTGFATQYNLFISPNSISNIIEQVKNNILEWAIVLEENNILGEELKFTNEEKIKAQIEPQIVNYINNFHSSVSDSQIQQGTSDSRQSF